MGRIVGLFVDAELPETDPKTDCLGPLKSPVGTKRAWEERADVEGICKSTPNATTINQN